MLSNLVYIITFVLLISGIETLGQSIIKYAKVNTAPLLILGGSACYFIITVILYYLYSFENMATINAWWNIVTSISVTLIGLYLFHEKLKHTDLIGISMVILGACFLSIDKIYG